MRALVIEDAGHDYVDTLRVSVEEPFQGVHMSGVYLPHGRILVSREALTVHQGDQVAAVLKKLGSPEIRRETEDDPDVEFDRVLQEVFVGL
jgi:hypothetical protein